MNSVHRRTGLAFAAIAMGMGIAPGASADPPPAPPAPTRAQLAALSELQKEASAYESAAKDYRATISTIVRQHYEDRKRRVLAALDAQLSIEKRDLEVAR